MRKILIALFCTLSAATTVNAQIQYYQISRNLNNGTCVITRYLGPAGAVDIPASFPPLRVVGIDELAFYYRTDVTAVTIPEGVGFIGDYAFMGTSVTNFEIPSTVTNIGLFTFWTPCLTSITVDPANPNYSSTNGVLCDKNQATIIEYPSVPTDTYRIPENITYVAQFAFYQCSLTNLIVGNFVTSLGYDQFLGKVSNLESIFLGVGVTNVNPQGVECPSLQQFNVNVQNQFYSSVDGVLFDKSQKTLCICPAGKTGDYTISNGVTSIADNAFVTCALNSVTLPGTTTNIGTGVFTPSQIKAIYVDSNNPAYSSSGGVLFNKSQTMLVECPGGVTGHYSVPAGVNSIALYAFTGCGLNAITTPGSVTNIGDYAFFNCTGLTSATMGNGLLNIGNHSFDNCEALAAVGFPSSLANVGDHAFNLCSSLTNLMFGGQVTNIETQAFQYCYNLESVYFAGNAPNTDSSAFSDDIPKVYYLPGTIGWGSTLAYLQTAPWALPNPIILNGNNSSPLFGVQSNGFGFTVSWATNLSLIVEASTNPKSGSWQPLKTNSLTNGSFYFSDAQWTNYPQQFYRVRTP